MAEARRGNVRVVTINTWKGDGPYSARLDALSTQLRELDADMIALQEALVAVDGSLSTPARLASDLSMHPLVHSTRRKIRLVEGGPVDSWSALAILTRWPIIEFMTLALPTDPEDGDRAAVFAALETPIGTLRLCNTHLSHLRERADLRREQLQTIVEHPFLRGPADARLVCGDMNATPSSSEMSWLHRNTGKWHVVDTYEAAGGPPPRATLSERNPYVTRGAGERVLDYVFSLADSRDSQPALHDARVVAAQPSEEGAYPSDHFGVAVSLRRSYTS